MENAADAAPQGDKDTKQQPSISKSKATIETPERASVSKFLAKFNKPNNVALAPDMQSVGSTTMSSLTMRSPAPPKAADAVATRSGQRGQVVTIETSEFASVSKALEKFDRPDNVALMPDKSLTPTAQQQRTPSPSKQQQREADAGDVPAMPAPEGTSLAGGESKTSVVASAAEPKPETQQTESPVAETTDAKESVQHTGEAAQAKATTAVSSCSHLVGSRVPSSVFAQERASKPLRVCCYGSSSSRTPSKYLQPAAEVGYLLGVRGHTCVNGAGSYGCMAALNDGAAAGNGHIVGVIHKMWLVDGSDAAEQANQEWQLDRSLPDPGAHSVFKNTAASGGGTINGVAQSHGGPHPALGSRAPEAGGPRREMLVAGGKDLQERKRLLVEGADALVVLPGGPGTFDELWENCCARNIGLSNLPIVCVNVDGYYEPFRQMLERAWQDQLTKLQPDEIIHFAETAEEAVRWVEEVQNRTSAPKVDLKKRKQVLRHQSVLGSPLISFSSWSSGWTKENEDVLIAAFALGTGLVLGFLLSQGRKRS